MYASHVSLNHHPHVRGGKVGHKRTSGKNQSPVRGMVKTAYRSAHKGGGYRRG